MNRRRGYESNAHRLADLNSVTEILAFLLFWPAVYGVYKVVTDFDSFRSAVLRMVGL